MSCEDYNKIIVKKGTILYNGIDLPTNVCPPKYKYKYNNNKNSNSNKYILYTANNIMAAKGYASSCLTSKKGWIREYKVLKDVELADISEDKLHYDVVEVINEFCFCDGYYLDWGGDKGKEIVFCDPKDKLELISTYKCTGKGLFNNSICSYNQIGSSKLKKDKRCGVYKHGNHTHKTKEALQKCTKNKSTL